MFNIDSPKKTIFKFEVFFALTTFICTSLRLGDYSFMINIISITITSSCFGGGCLVTFDMFCSVFVDVGSF